MGPVETGILAAPAQQQQQQQQQQPQKSKRRSRSNERNSREDHRQKSRRSARSRSGDHESSSSSSNDHDDGHGSMDDDDDASASDRSSRGSSAVKQLSNVRWDHRTSHVGRRIKETKVFCCLNCRYPVLLVGRLVPCKHAAFCLQCANECKNGHRKCPKCNDDITDVEKIELKNVFLCNHGSHPHSPDACLRGYTSQRDLQEHVKRRHEQPTQPGQTRLDSPLQLLPAPIHSPSGAFPGLVVDPQQPQSLPPGPPALMPFPPMNVPAMAPPPPSLFDLGFRPPNYGHPPPPQQFVPPQQQYRPPPPYPPNRSFY